MKSTKFDFCKISLSEFLVLFFQAIVLLILFFALGKGVDLTDEGLYFALSQPMQDNYFAQLNQNILFSLFYELTGISFGLKGLRLLKFLLLITSFFAIYPILKYYRVGRFWCFICFFGLFGHYAYFGQSLSYNTLTFFFYCIFLKYLFTHLFQSKNDFPAFWSGFFSSLAFVSKSTTGLLLLALGVVFFLILSWNLNRRFNFIKPTLIFISGFIIVQFFLSLLFVDYNFFEVIKNGLELGSYNSTHNKLSIIKYPLSAFKWILILMFSGFLLRLTLDSDKLNKKITYFLSTLILLLWFYLSHDRLDLYRFYEFSFLLFSYFLIGYSLKNMINFDFESIILLSILLISPLIVSFGTISYHFKGGVLYSFFLFVLLSILNRYEYDKSHFVKFGIIVIVLLLTSKIFLNTIYLPFKQPSLLSQLKPYTYLNERKILLPQNYYDYLTKLNHVFDKYTSKEDKILGLYEMPGDILLAGRYHAINPCFWEQYQLEFNLEKAESEGLLDKVKFVLSQEKIFPQLFRAETIVLLDSLHHPNFGSIYFSKVDRY